MKKRIQALFAAMCVVALAVVMVGCGGGSSSSSSAASSSSSSSSSTASSTSSSSTAEAVELQIFAANSLEKALPEVQALYTQQNPEVTFADTQFKASGDLVTQLEADTDAADLLITASGKTMDNAVEGALVDEATRVDMFTNDLVLCAKEGSALTIADVTDLVSDTIASFAMGDPAVVPAGDYAAQTLASAGLIEYDADNKAITAWTDATLEAKANTGADKVGTVASYVSDGTVDVGFVYSSDIYRYDGIETVYTVPSDMHKAIKYPGAVTADAANSEAAADFLDFCINNAQAQAIFAEYGFELA